MWILYLIFMMVCQSLVDLAVPVNFNSLSDERAYRIKPRVCADRHNAQGICMFQWECRQQNGIMLATCLDRFLFGTCCKIPPTLEKGRLNVTSSNETSATISTTTAASSTSNVMFTLTSIDQNVSNSSIESSVTTMSTQDVQDIFHEFLGSVLANYSPSNTVSSNEVTEENEILHSVSPYLPTWQESSTATEEHFIDGTAADEFIDYSNSEVSHMSQTLYPTSSDTSAFDTQTSIVEESEEQSINSVHEVINHVTNDETTEFHYEGLENVHEYDVPTTSGQPEMTATTTEPTTTTTTTTEPTTTAEPKTTTTTTETTTTTTTTQRPQDYKKDGTGPRFLFFPGSWSSLIRVLLAVPALIGSWLAGGHQTLDHGGGGTGCDGAVACEPLDQSLASADSPAAISIPNEAYCGIRPLIPEGRIVGGTDSTFGEWPWQVLIKEATWLGLFVKNKCGGVLLNQFYVVTAAHCQPGFLASLLVIFGETDLSVHSGELKPLQRNVRRVVVHKKYNALTFDNDLALLELEKPVDYHPHIVPICLPPDNEDFTGRVAVVSGWGRLKYGGRLPHDLQSVQVPIMTNSKCQQMFLSAGHIKAIGSKFLCAGFQDGGKDSCEGDSGGPLVLQDDEGRWILVGTVSHGIKCAYPNLPGVYIKITAYKSWIQKTINS